MRNGAVRDALRLWVAIIAAWALLMSVILPTAALAAGPVAATGVICSTGAADGPSSSGDMAVHDGLCCVLCAASGPAAVPPPPTDAVRVVPADGALVILGAASLPVGPRAPPQVWPLNPRAPPIDA